MVDADDDDNDWWWRGRISCGDLIRGREIITKFGNPEFQFECGNICLKKRLLEKRLFL